MPECGWTVGPVWKLDGETCVCILDEGHVERSGTPHACSCGSWFEGCGRPKSGGSVRQPSKQDPRTSREKP